MGAQTPTAAQMSLGKSARLIPLANKVLKVGGGNRHQNPKYDQVITEQARHPKQDLYRINHEEKNILNTLKSISPSVSSRSQKVTNIASKLPSASAVPVTGSSQTKTLLIVKKPASTGRDPLSLWGDALKQENPQKVEPLHEGQNYDDDDAYDFELMLRDDKIPFMMMNDDANVDDDSIGEMWSEDQPTMIEDLGFLGDEMTLVDPRDIEGCISVEAEAVNEDSNGLSQTPDGFDLLEFVMSSTIGTEDPVFRSLIGDELLFVQEEEVDHAQPTIEAQDSADLLLTTIDADEINLLASVDQSTFEPALPAVAVVLPKEEEPELSEVPAKKPRGRPRVPRTSMLKPLPK